MKESSNVAEFSSWLEFTFINYCSIASIDHKTGKAHQWTKVPHEVPMVVGSNTITHPRAMVIEFCHTTITKRTMFRPEMFLNIIWGKRWVFASQPTLVAFWPSKSHKKLFDRRDFCHLTFQLTPQLLEIFGLQSPWSSQDHLSKSWKNYTTMTPTMSKTAQWLIHPHEAWQIPTMSSKRRICWQNKCLKAWSQITFHQIQTHSSNWNKYRLKRRVQIWLSNPLAFGKSCP